MPTSTIFGTPSADLIYGTSTHDASIAVDEVFYGEGGADIIYAGGGNDWIWGFEGDTASVTFFGQDGDDTLISFAGADWLQGDAGNDTLIAGAGADTLLGGDGGDFLVGGLYDQTRDYLIGGAGADEFSTDGTSDYQYGGAGLELVDWVWDFSLTDGDRIKFGSGESTATQVEASERTIDGVTGTLVYGGSHLVEIRTGYIWEADPAIFLAGVSLTTEQLLAADAFIFA